MEGEDYRSEIKRIFKLHKDIKDWTYDSQEHFISTSTNLKKTKVLLRYCKWERVYTLLGDTSRVTKNQWYVPKYDKLTRLEMDEHGIELVHSQWNGERRLGIMWKRKLESSATIIYRSGIERNPHHQLRNQTMPPLIYSIHLVNVDDMHCLVSYISTDWWSARERELLRVSIVNYVNMYDPWLCNTCHKRTPAWELECRNCHTVRYGTCDQCKREPIEQFLKVCDRCSK